MQLSAIRKSLVFLMALGVSGCFLDQIDDESTGGGDPTDPVVIAEDDVHAGLSEMAVDLVTGVLSELPTWLQGLQETPSRTNTVQWDSINNVWVLTGSEDYDDPEVSGHVTFRTTIQFLTGGVAVQHPTEQTDQVEVTQNATNAGIYDPGEFQVEFNVEANHELSIVENGELGATVTGAGGISGRTETTVNGQTYVGNPDIGWTTSLHLSESHECGAGQISGRGGDYEFVAQLDGNGQMDFVVYHDGRTVESETKSYDCPNFGGEESARTVTKLEVIGPEAARQATMLMSEVARWLSGDLGAPDPLRDATEPLWDEIDQSWQWAESASTSNHEWDANIKVKYLSGSGAVQQQPDETTDAMEIELFVHVVGIQDMPGDRVTYDLEFRNHFEVGDFGAFPYRAQGGGEIRGSVGIPEGNNFGADALWDLFGRVTDTRCPDGEFVVAIGDHRLDATFNGTGNVDWEVRDPSGQRVSWSGFPVGCGN